MPNNEEKLYLSVIDISYPESFEEYFWGPGVRDVYVLHYIRSGSGFFECGGKTYHLHAGQSFLIVPGKLINYYPDPSDPWKYTWVNFLGIEAKKLLRHCALCYENPVTLYPNYEPEPLFKDAAQRFKTATAADICRNVGLFRIILSEYIRLYPADISTETADITVTRAAEYIENNYRRPELNIDEISEYIGINRVTLHRKFTEELGISPGNYIINLRIQKACILLKQSDYPIKSIAYSTGFSDQLYFAKAFKKQTGLTPTQYRSQSV